MAISVQIGYVNKPKHFYCEGGCGMEIVGEKDG